MSNFDLLHLWQAGDKVGRARAERDAAGFKLDLELIRERMWELRSQHQPLADITSGDREQRETILRCVQYVVTGQWPEEKKEL